MPVARNVKTFIAKVFDCMGSPSENFKIFLCIFFCYVCVGRDNVFVEIVGQHAFQRRASVPPSPQKEPRGSSQLRNFETSQRSQLAA